MLVVLVGIFGGRQIYEDILERGLQLVHTANGDPAVLEQRTELGFLPLGVKGEVQRLTEQCRASNAALSAHELHRLDRRVGVDRDRAAAQPSLQLRRRVERRELALAE